MTDRKAAMAKILASVETLHGGPRDRIAKYESFLAWQIKARREASGDVEPSILKKSVSVETGS